MITGAFFLNASIYFGIGILVGTYFNTWIKENTKNPEVDLKPFSLWGQTLFAGYLWPLTLVLLFLKKIK